MYSISQNNSQIHNKYVDNSVVLLFRAFSGFWLKDWILDSRIDEREFIL